MDFSQLTLDELNEFLNIDYGVSLDPTLSLEDRAKQLFNHLKKIPNIVFPYPVIDLYLASTYRGDRNQEYTYNQIMNLSESEIRQFRQLFGDPQLNKDRILNILSFMRLIIKTREDRLFDPTVLQQLCSTLPLNDLNNFRKANYLDRLDCQIPIDDPDNQIKSVSYLSDDTYPLLSQIRSQGSGKLFFDTAKDDLNLVKYLVQHGMNPNYTNMYSQTALYPAIENNRLDIVKYLIEIGTDPNHLSNGIDNALHHASLRNKVDIAEYLIPFILDIDIKKHTGSTPLTLAVYYGYLEMVKLLVKHGADIYVKDVNQDSLLNIAARNGFLPIVKYLVEQGLDPNSKGFNDGSPLMDAGYKGHLNIMEYLIQNGADLNHKNRYGGVTYKVVLETAVKKGRLDIIKYLLDNFPTLDYNIDHLLIDASDHNYFNIVKYLVEKGANVNVQDVGGDSPLMSAVENGNLDMVKYLIENGANVKQRNDDGETVLSMAEDDDIYNFLLKHGASE